MEKYVEIVQSHSSDKYVHRYNIEILNLLDQELQLIKTKPMIKNKLKELISKLEKFKFQTILVLEYKERNDRKIFHSVVKLIASDSDIGEASISTNQSIMTTIKNYASKDWIVLDVIIKHSTKIFACYYKEKK